MKTIDWAGLVAATMAAFAAFAALAKAATKWITQRTGAKRIARLDETARERIRTIRETHNLLNRALVDGGATRVMLIKSHNGSGMPKIGHPTRITVLQEVWSPSSRSVRDNWQGRLMDPAYGEVLYRVHDEGFATIHTDALPAGSKLRTVYEADGVARSTLMHVASARDGIFFLSANDANDLAALRRVFDELRDLLVRHLIED